MNAAIVCHNGTAGTYGLRVEALTLQRGHARVLEDVSLHARPGRLLALVGPNGAGKSSLLSVLAGLLVPTRGHVVLDGRPLAQWPARDLARRRAMLSQKVQMGFGFSAYEVAMLGRSPHPMTRGARDGRVVEIAMRATHVWSLRDRNYLRLSGGEQRRVQLARVLAQVGVTPGDEAAWLLLDEPEAGLDIAHQHFVLHLARRLARQGQGVIVVLHDLNLAAGYADEIALLASGRVVGHGPPAQVLDPDLLSTVYGIPLQRSALANGAGWVMLAR